MDIVFNYQEGIAYFYLVNKSTEEIMQTIIYEQDETQTNEEFLFEANCFNQELCALTKHYEAIYKDFLEKECKLND